MANFISCVEFEFYFPRRIVKTKPVKAFIESTQSLAGGSVSFPGAFGEWRNKKERTQIFRIVLKSSFVKTGNIRARFGRQLRRMNLELDKSLRQRELVFSEKRIHWIVNRLDN
jgi:hypothetical protein